MFKKAILMACFVAFCATYASISAAATLDKVQQRGKLLCGVDGGLAGFSAPDDSGKMRGIDADVCYAVAAAVFGPFALLGAHWLESGVY